MTFARFRSLLFKSMRSHVRRFPQGYTAFCPAARPVSAVCASRSFAGARRRKYCVTASRARTYLAIGYALPKLLDFCSDKSYAYYAFCVLIFGLGVNLTHTEYLRLLVAIYRITVETASQQSDFLSREVRATRCGQSLPVLAAGVSPGGRGAPRAPGRPTHFRGL